MTRTLLKFIVAWAALSAMCGIAAKGYAASAPSYDSLFSKVEDVPLGEGTGRIDYQSIDPAAHRLYIAKMGAGKLLVFNTEERKLAAELDGFPKITGVLAVPALQKVFASVPGAGLRASLSVALGIAGLSSGSGAVAILDMTTLREIARLPGGVFPDGIAYDANDEKVFVSDEFGGAILAIDAKTDKLVARIDAGGQTGNVQYDPITKRIYAPVQSHDELIVIDPEHLQVGQRYRLGGCRHPHGLAIAPKAAIGYVACDGNDKLLTVDLPAGKVLAAMPVAHDPDVLTIDAAANRLYVASESGNLSSFDIAEASAPRALGDVFIGEDAHSVAADPSSHRLYFPLADISGRAVLRILAPK